MLVPLGLLLPIIMKCGTKLVYGIYVLACSVHSHVKTRYKPSTRMA